MDQINIGMIGGGTVGSGVFHALQQNADLMAARIGLRLGIGKVAVKAFDEPRPYPISPSVLTLNWHEVVEDPAVQVVIELVGGTGIARTMILAALERGKPVVTANKALLSATARSCSPPPANLEPISTTKPVSPAESPSSRSCAKAWSATGSTGSTASSTAPATTSSPG